jgi:hypothetical protein
MAYPEEVLLVALLLPPDRVIDSFKSVGVCELKLEDAGSKLAEVPGRPPDVLSGLEPRMSENAFMLSRLNREKIASSVS